MGVDLKSLLSTIPDPGNLIITILIAIYWIFIASYIEEWFWRAFYKECMYYRLLDRLWIAAIWGLMYVVLIFVATGDMIATIIAFVSLFCIGYLFHYIYRERSWSTMYLCHKGLNGGIIACWFLANAGMW